MCGKESCDLAIERMDGEKEGLVYCECPLRDTQEASASSRFRFRAENSFATTDTYSQKYPIGTPTSGVLYISPYDTTDEAATSLLCITHATPNKLSDAKLQQGFNSISFPCRKSEFVLVGVNTEFSCEV